jgi:hypothetical protein
VIWALITSSLSQAYHLVEILNSCTMRVFRSEQRTNVHLCPCAPNLFNLRTSVVTESYAKDSVVAASWIGGT